MMLKNDIFFQSLMYNTAWYQKLPIKWIDMVSEGVHFKTFEMTEKYLAFPICRYACEIIAFDTSVMALK